MNGIVTFGMSSEFTEAEDPLSPVSIVRKKIVPPLAKIFRAIAARIISVFNFNAKYASTAAIRTPTSIPMMIASVRLCVNPLTMTPTNAEVSMIPSSAMFGVPADSATRAANAASSIGVVTRYTCSDEFKR